MPMYSLIERRDNYSKPLESLWQYFRDFPGEADNTAITVF